MLKKAIQQVLGGNNKNVILVLGVRIMSVLLNFCGVFFVDRFFGNEPTAFYQFTINVFLVCAALSTVGMSQSIVYAYHESNEKTQIIPIYLKQAILVALGLFALFYLVVNTFFETSFYYFIWIYASFAIILSSIRKIRGELVSAVLLENVVPHLIFFVSVLATYSYFGGESFDTDFPKVLSILAMATIIVMVALAWRELPDLKLKKSDVRFYFDLMKLRGIANFISTGLSILLNKTELFILVYLGLIADGGWFVKSLLIANICSLPMIFMSSYFFPNFARMTAAGNMAEARDFFLSCRNKILMGTVAFAVLSAILAAGYFYTLGYVRFETVVSICFIVGGCLVSAAFGDFHYGLIGMARERYCAYTNFAAIVVNVVVGFILISNFGELGAAATVFVTHIVKSVIGRFLLVNAGLFKANAV